MHPCFFCAQYHREPLYFMDGAPVYSIPRCTSGQPGFPAIGRDCATYQDRHPVSDPMEEW